MTQKPPPFCRRVNCRCILSSPSRITICVAFTKAPVYSERSFLSGSFHGEELKPLSLHKVGFVTVPLRDVFEIRNNQIFYFSFVIFPGSELVVERDLQCDLKMGLVACLTNGTGSVFENVLPD